MMRKWIGIKIFSFEMKVLCQCLVTLSTARLDTR
uniref:Uncharacterized protein n=1 Tax=Rhizophora mucronata TaxID=61149 RepID=A0A2P2PLX5_RHIMU